MERCKLNNLSSKKENSSYFSLYFYVIKFIGSMFIMQGLDLQGIIVETERRGMSFDQLLTIPEQDEWVYSDGKSTTCVSFILAMYKEAGVFAPFSESIQVTEFTVSFLCMSCLLL